MSFAADLAERTDGACTGIDTFAGLTDFTRFARHAGTRGRGTFSGARANLAARASETVAAVAAIEARARLADLTRRTGDVLARVHAPSAEA